MSRLMGILGAAVAEGRFQGTRTVRLAQALTKAAEPYIVSGSPRPWAGACPIDHELDALLLAQESASEVLSAILRGDMPDGAHLLCGTLKTYSHSQDVVLRAGLRVGATARPQPSVLNGASFLYWAPQSDVAVADMNDDWMAFWVGGLFPFIDGIAEPIPSLSWRTRLGWTPSATNPLRWLRDGQTACWYERFHGPIRGVYGGDSLHRQPLISRWLFTATEWQRLVEMLQTTPILDNVIETEPWGSPIGTSVRRPRRRTHRG